MAGNLRHHRSCPRGRRMDVMRCRSRAGLSIGIGITASVASLMPGHAASGAAPHPWVASSFGIAPQNCAIASDRLIHHDRTTHSTWIGAGALAANSGWYIANRRLALGFGYRTRYGYPQKIFWQLMDGFHGPVTLRGWNVRTGRRIWFGRPIPGPQLPAGVPPPVIAWPSGIARSHRAPSLTFVPSAGCYILQATWKSGSWRVPFTAGG